jgi:hypothetical protein
MNPEPETLADTVVFPHVVDDAFYEVQMAIISQKLIHVILQSCIVIYALYLYGFVVKREKAYGGITIDGSVHDGTAIFIAIGGHVGPASAEAYPQRHPGSRDHAAHLYFRTPSEWTHGTRAMV